MAYNIEANKRGLFAVLFDECYRAFFYARIELINSFISLRYDKNRK